MSGRLAATTSARAAATAVAIALMMPGYEPSPALGAGLFGSLAIWIEIVPESVARRRVCVRTQAG
jgi:hypothetical protein